MTERFQRVISSGRYDRNSAPIPPPRLRPRLDVRPTLDAQREQLKAEGCTKVYREKASGARADRRELLRMLKDITPNSEVTVTRIDRLVRSTFDLFAVVKQIVDAGGQFRSLAK